jgi:ferritin-like metal-binding protein YciE
MVKALAKLADAATCNHLKEAFLSHLKETEGHAPKLQKVFESFDEKAQGTKCEAAMGLLEECEEIAVEFDGSPALDAALICVAQKVEHYETASYGCLHEWAIVLGNAKAAAILEDILEEERAVNDTLTELAETRNNKEALGHGGPIEDADEKPVVEQGRGDWGRRPAKKETKR